MKYYTIQGDSILIADSQETLTRFYDGVKILPDDYEEGKYIIVDGDLARDEAWEEKQAQAERERIAKLKLTKREVFLGLYLAKQVTPEMIKAQITDPMALIEFEYANDYFRGNPLIDIVGGALGITPEQLDKFFEFNDYTYLLPVEVEDEDTTNTTA
jgi:hypothetical protein